MVLKRAFVLSVTVSAILSSVNATTYSELKDFLESSGSNSITLDSDVNSPESTTIVMNSGHKTINAQSYSFNNTYGSSNIRRGIMIQNSASLTINNLNMNGFRQNSAIDFNTSTTLNVNNSNFTNNKHIGSTGLSQGGAITNSGLGTLNISG